MLIPFEYRRDWHIIIQAPFMHFVKDRFPDKADHLFLYRHKLWGTFVIAGWVNKDRGRMVDILNLGTTPDFTREHVKELDFVLRPDERHVLTSESLGRMLRSQERDDDRQQMEEHEELLDLQGQFIPKFAGPYFNAAKDRRRKRLGRGRTLKTYKV